MKIRNILLLFLSLWFLLYLLSNPEICCMEKNPCSYALIDTKTIYDVQDSPFYNLNEQKIARYLGELRSQSFPFFSRTNYIHLVRICLEVCQENGIEADSFKAKFQLPGSSPRETYERLMLPIVDHNSMAEKLIREILGN